MNALKVIGALMLVLGVLAMGIGGFDYTQDRTALKIGPVQLDVKEQKHVSVPLWAGAGLALVGAGVLVLGARKS
jgi:membrane-bound ClpP family serine protease